MDTNEYTSAQRGFFSEAEPTERLTLYVMFINVICGLVSVMLPLVPSPIEAFSGRRVLYNLLGVVNQQVGGDTTRTDAFPLLLLYYVAVIVMAAGCVSAFYRLKSSMCFCRGLAGRGNARTGSFCRVLCKVAAARYADLLCFRGNHQCCCCAGTRVVVKAEENQNTAP